MQALIAAAAAMMAMASPALAGNPILIEMHGDSTTRGNTGNPAANHISTFNEPADLAAWLWGVTVVNKGVGGTTCYERLSGTPGYYHKNIWDEMRDSTATIVTFNYGYNDTGRLEESFFKECMQTLIRVAKGYGKIVAVETPLGTDPAVARYANIVVNVAADEGAHLIDHMALMDDRYPEWRNHLPDLMHPDDQLYIQKALIAYAVLGPIVSDLLAGN